MWAIVAMVVSGVSRLAGSFNEKVSLRLLLRRLPLQLAA